jgi:two-component system, cell cycle sensor histidine kinase and response regulator CckA
MIDDPATLASLRSQVEDLALRLRNAEEQLAQAQKMEVLGRLTGGIAHDFNNLLTGILGYASLLKTLIPEGGDASEAASYIERSARRASELTRKLLAYSRRESTNFRPVEIHKIVGEAVGILSRSVNKNVDIRANLGATRDLVMGDSGALLQALLNLGVNAGDAMPDGGALTLSTEPFVSDGTRPFADVPVPEGAYICVSVSDTGTGIPDELREQVFAPFFTTKAPGEGTGLGLSMVRTCVRNHGGFLRVDSRPGEGATFRLLLPVSADSARAVEAGARETHAPRGSETVLVIEDEDIPRHLLCDLLRSLGYTPLPAPSGEAGIVLASAPTAPGVDLVIVDKIMPGLSGPETMRRLRALRPSLRSILCSGHDGGEASGEERAEGFDEYLRKPYELETLARKVRAVLDRRSSSI